MDANSTNMNLEYKYFQERLNIQVNALNNVMKYLLPTQWVASIFLSLFISPLTWIGDESGIHPHVIASIFLGALLTLPSIYFIKNHSTEFITRLMVGISQLAFSGLLIHVTGGRIETHFHIFASLSIISLYFDWRVVIGAAALTALDHIFRGLFFPMSIFGNSAYGLLNIIEHAWWVVFQVGFLLWMIPRFIKGMKEQAVLRVSAEKLAEQSKIAERDAKDKERLANEIKNRQVEINELQNKFATEIISALDSVSRGNLNTKVTNSEIETLNKITLGFNAFVREFNSIVSETRSITDQVEKTVSSINNLAGVIKNETQEELHTAQEVSRATSEMVDTISTNSKIGVKMVESVRKNAQLAESGSFKVLETQGVIQQVANNMADAETAIERFESVSKEITSIVYTIQDIAEQTNLLALNASIEAARAGEHGRGFTVVAQAVRTLAEKTQHATRNVETLVRQITEETNNTVTILTKSKVSSQSSVGAIHEVADKLSTIAKEAVQLERLVEQFATATEEQSVTSEHIAKQVDHSAELSNRSYKRSIQIADDATSLNIKVQQLTKSLSRFST